MQTRQREQRGEAAPTGEERRFGLDEIIVTKTDTRGLLTYANDVFLRMSAYAEVDVIGRPHSLVRHPDMPRCVYKLLWETIAAGHELFAYVVNLASDGAHYWVFAHITPTFDAGGTIVGYHSNRRVPARAAVVEAGELYAVLRQEEARHAHPVEAMDASRQVLDSHLAAAGCTYDEWVWDVTARAGLPS